MAGREERDDPRHANRRADLRAGNCRRHRSDPFDHAALRRGVPMTDPTDAIAALEPFAPTVELDYPDDKPTTITIWTGENSHMMPGPVWGAFRRAREVRSALLSAQEQAEKPVAWRVKIGDSDIWAFAKSKDDANWRVKQSGLRGVVEPLYVQPQPAVGVTDTLTTARTALEVAEKAFSNINRQLSPGHRNFDMLIADAGNAVDEARLGLSTVSSALVTIKGLEPS